MSRPSSIRLWRSRISMVIRQASRNSCGWNRKTGTARLSSSLITASAWMSTSPAISLGSGEPAAKLQTAQLVSFSARCGVQAGGVMPFASWIAM